MEKTFRYETPIWGARLLCIIYLCISIGFFCTYYNYETWAGNSEAFLKYFFLIFSVIFLFISLKPSNRKGWVYFSANDKGLYFPFANSYLDSLPELHVPWENVGDIKSEVLYGGTNGISIELLLSDDEVNLYCKGVKLVNKLLGFDCKRNGFYVIAYANNTFQSASKVILILNQLKSKNI